MLKALFVSLRESWCDTTTDFGRLMLTIMGGIAEFEHNLILRRTEEGIAKRQGKQFGRPNALDNGQKRKIAERITNTLIEEGKAQLEHIHVTFLDLPTTNYAVFGKLVADQKPSP